MKSKRKSYLCIATAVVLIIAAWVVPNTNAKIVLATGETFEVEHGSDYYSNGYALEYTFIGGEEVAVTGIVSLAEDKSINVNRTVTYGDQVYDVTALLLPPGSRGADQVAEIWCDTRNSENKNLFDIDVSGCVNLEKLVCSSTEISNLDVTNNTRLTTLECANTSISRLDLSNNPFLMFLDCKGTNINDLDLSGKEYMTNVKAQNMSNLTKVVTPEGKTLTARVQGGGSLTITDYDLNSNVILEAIPTSGNEFQGWNFNVPSQADSAKPVNGRIDKISFTFTENLVMTAVFTGAGTTPQPTTTPIPQATPTPAPTNTPTPTPVPSGGTLSVGYSSHVQSDGWKSPSRDGAASGTEGQGKRLEGIWARLENIDQNVGGISYRTHVQTYGWTGWKSNGDVSGTVGEAKRLEAIEIILSGSIADTYDIYYRVHAQQFGWMEWAKNGERAGTAGYGYRLEAIQIKLVNKGGTPPSGGLGIAYREKTATIDYSTHIKSVGWLPTVYDGALSGPINEGKWIESIRMSVSNVPASGSIEYRSRVQGAGWENRWVQNNQKSGTEGQGKYIEAVEIRLTGEMAAKYDIYYCVYVRGIGWLGWGWNGETAGTVGYDYPIESIQIRLVEKEAEAPGFVDESKLPNMKR